jgi:hypothetical protein
MSLLIGQIVQRDHGRHEAARNALVVVDAFSPDRCRVAVPRNPCHSCVDECNHRARVHIGRVFVMNDSGVTYRIAQPVLGQDAG